MKREIKFRGKNNCGKWVYGAYAAFKGLQGAIYFPKRHRNDGRILFIDWCYVDEKTVGQFTGLYDKNGKEIYEGDIVRIHDYQYDENSLDKVVFGGGVFGVMNWTESLESLTTLNFFIPRKVDEDMDYDVEVIGNIHDNKLEDFKE